MATIEELAEEAAKGGAEAAQDLERKIEEALACPCVEDLREGPCGKQFSQAFSCYIRNFKTEQLDECYPRFEAMHSCMANNTAAFAEFKQPAQASEASKRG